MKNGKLKYLTDEDELNKFDDVEKERKERLKGKYAPYLSRTRFLCSIPRRRRTLTATTSRRRPRPPTWRSRQR